MRISLTMIVKNESENLHTCLEKTKALVDEIIIVDTGSTDNTKEIALKFTDKVFDYQWDNNFSNARNFALEKSSGDWNLILDADEFVESGSKEELVNFASENPDSIGKILVVSKYIDGESIEYSRERISRFAPKMTRFSGAIHEQLDSKCSRKDVNLSVNHIGYYKTNKSERNLKMLYEALKLKPNDNYILYQIAKTLFSDKNYSDAEPYFKKAYKYIDSKAPYSKDLIISYIYNSINIEKGLEKSLKVIQKHKNKYKNDVDFNFVCGVFYTSLVLSNIEKYIEYLTLIEKSYLKCIELGDSEASVLGVGTYKAYYNLAAIYEVAGNIDTAKLFYSKSAEYGYNLANRRLSSIE